MSLDDLRLAAAMAMLAGASVLDLRTRRVPNLFWLPFAGAAVGWDLLEAADRAAAGSDVRWSLLVAALAATLCGFFYGLWRFGLFGGGDAKGMMVLALLVPWPVLAPAPLALPIPPAVGILMLASVCVLFVPITFLLWNVAHGHLLLPAALLGVPMPLEAARDRRVWPMQDVDPSGRVRWRYWVRLRGDLAAHYARLEAAGLHQVWTTPKVPFMVPLLAGTVLWVFVRGAGAAAACPPC